MVTKAGIKVAGILVAFSRDELLGRALKATQSQTFPCNEIYVVDNANLASTKSLVLEADCHYVPGDVNFGSAGGFALGISTALNSDNDFVWTLDDDGYPDTDCLNKLVDAVIAFKLDIASPLSLAQEDHRETANPYLFKFKKITNAEFIKRRRVWIGKVQFYNGMLMSRRSVETIGFPKKELFLRGDEMDYYYRSKRAHLKMGLATEATFYHPSGAGEFANSRNSLLGVVVPQTKNKRYYQFRNRGYLVKTYRLLFNGVYDWVRYPLYFLIGPDRNIEGFKEWRKLWLQGFRGDLTPFKD